MRTLIVTLLSAIAFCQGAWKASLPKTEPADCLSKKRANIRVKSSKGAPKDE